MTYTGRTTVNQGTLILGAGNHTLAVSQPLMVNQGGTLDLGNNSQYLGNLSSAGSVEDSGGIVTGTGGTLTLNQTTDAIFAGSIQGSVNLVKSGLRTLTLTSANPTTGSVAIIGGLGSVRERNNTGDLGFGITLRDGGTLSATSAITVRNSTLNLDNTGTRDMADRVSDTAPITLDNGTIRFVGRQQSNSSETLGPVTVSGFSAITMLVAGNANTQTGQHSAILTLTSLTRNPGAIIHFNRSGGVNTPLGQLGNRPRVLLAGDNTGGLTLCNDTVVGMYTNNDNDKMMPVSYVPGLGFGNMGQAGFPNHYMAGADGNGFTGSNTLASALATNDFNTSSSQLVKLGGQTVNSLGIQGNASTLLNFQAPDDTLTIQSGWLALWFSRNTLGDTTNRGAITSGQSELFLFGDHLAALNPNNVNTIHSVIKNNGTDSVKFVMGLARDTYLTADNTYTGGTVVSDLVARENGGTGYFDGTFARLYLNATTAGAVTIPNAATPAEGLVLNSANVTMLVNAGQIGSDNIVTLNGGSVLTLVGNNSLAGLVFNSNGGTITPSVAPAGTLTLTGDLTANLTNPAVSPLIDTGALDFSGAVRNVTVTALPDGDYPDYTGLRISSAIQNGGLTKTGSGTLTLSGSNIYSGATMLSEGTLSVGADDNLGNANPLVFNGGTLRITGTSLTSYAAGSISSHPVTLTAGKDVGLDINAAANTFTVSEVLNQTTGGLTKAGTGTLVLDRANTYSGATTIKAGILKLDGSGGIANSSSIVVGDAGSSDTVLDVSSKSGGFTVGGSQTLGGIGTIIGSTTIAGIHTPGNSAGVQTFTGGLTYAASSHLQWQLFDNTTAGRGSLFDGVDVTGGAFSIAPGATLDLSFGGAVSFVDSFWNSAHTWTVADLGGGLTGDGGLDLFSLGTITGGGYSASEGTFSVTRVADASSRNDVVLNWTAATGSSPYQNWIDSYTAIPVPDRDPEDDPDHDGVSNLAEFAFKGVPNDASKRGVFHHEAKDNGDVDSLKELTFTCAVRRSSVNFAVNGSNAQQSASAIDEVTYTIEGSATLTGAWTGAVGYIGKSDTAPAGSGLPSLSGTDWEYRSFSAFNGMANQGFLRAKADR
jgi:autotransporter-associated beta strand protein